MAKVRGPLFSFGASGTVGGLLTFNPETRQCIARRKPSAYPAPTMPQASTRQKCREAAATWRALPAIDRAEWAALAATTGRQPFAKYLLEWFAQHASPSNPPFIPMA